MTSRERVKTVLRGELPDRVPFNFWMDRDRMSAFDAIYGHDFRLTHYGADVVEAMVMVPWWSSLTAVTSAANNTIWHVEPMIASVTDAIALPLPDPSSPLIYADVVKKCAMYPDNAVFALLLAPLDVLYPLRLTEGLCTDVLDHPTEVHQILERVCEVLKEVVIRVCALDIDVLYLAGDICGRNGPTMSPHHLKEFMFDYVREFVEIAHRSGKKVFYHTDGQVTDILDIFIDYGFDGINPLEPRCNNTMEFVDRSDGKLIVYGGLDNTHVIPNCSVSEVNKHVRSQFDALGKSGRLIFSTHDIPASCPVQNLNAMVKEVKACVYPGM